MTRTDTRRSAGMFLLAIQAELSGMSAQTKRMSRGYEMIVSGFACCMRRGKGVLPSALLVMTIWLLFMPVSRALAGEVTLLTPATGKQSMFSRNKVLNVVVKLTDMADLDRLALTDDRDGQYFDPIGRHVKDNLCYVHFQVILNKGVNAFTLAPTGQKFSIRYTPLSSLLNIDLEAPGVYLFHRQEAIPEECAGCHSDKLPPDAVVYKVKYGQFSPECYSCHSGIVSGSEWLHFPASAMLCRTCHQSRSDAQRLIVPIGKVENLCFECHLNDKKWIGMSHIHGPVGTGDCTICHDPHGSGNKFQLWADGKAKLCVVCHDGMKKYIEGGPRNIVVHGILKAQGCGACHSPHATNFRFQLYQEINELCVGCHTGLAGLDKGHPVQKHPLTGNKDPLRAGFPFTCTSCHDPHGSPYKYMLIGDVRGGRVCVKCHQGKLN